MGVKKRKFNPKPVINYPPVPQRKWIPPDKRPKPKRKPGYVKPPGISQKLAISTLKKIWHQYTIYGNASIIVGHFSQIHKRFNFITNGRQGACNCAMACLFAYLYKMEDWDRFYLDRILDHGDQLCFRSLQQPEDTCLTEIPPEKILTSFFFERSKVTLSLDEGPRVTDKLAEVTEQRAKEIFKNAIESFFKSYASGIFAMLEKYLAIWIKDDSYYMFDPTPHDEYGQRWYGVPGCGCGEVFSGFSLLCRCKVLEDLVENIYNNVSAKTPNSKFEIIECTVQRIVKINVVPPCCFEEYMVLEEPKEPEEEEPEEPPVDILAERLRAYIEEEKEETSSLKVKVEEISPDVTDGLSVSKRPSWLQDTVDKGDVCKYGLPKKPNPEKVSFYLELLPERMFILRGSTCQTDPNFSKYQGRQSMGNAISAIIMLRFYKSKVWVPRIVNTILKYGDLLYRDAMISIPRTQSLKLSNFQRKTEMEGRKFAPVVEDYVVVGRLQSKDYDVLDLEPALENYLLDQECCVLIGPITLAVWYEDKRYYWFDPNERDKNGKFIRKTAKIGGCDVPLDYAPGVACVMWFAALKDLVELYMNNVEKAKKWDPFYISKVQINDFIEIPDPWYNFKGIVPGKWILRGTICQWSKTFSRDSRNYQSPATALIALALQILKPEKEWETETIDEILVLGDQLYNASIQFLTDTGKLVNKMLMLSEVNKIFVLSDKEANFEIDDCIINGIINAKSENDLKNLKMGLEDFFIDNDTAVVTSHNISVAVWKKDEIFYCYDAHSRDDKGIATGYGTACVLRTLDLDELARSLEMNLSPGKEDFYNINRIKIKFYETGDGIVRPPLNFYSSVNEDVAILRSLYSEITTKYDLNCRKQTIPMCLVALSFNKLKPSTEWTKPDLDEILNKGDNLYVQSMLKIQKEEEEEGGANEEAPPSPEGEEEEQEEDGIVNSANVKREFILGLNKINVEFEAAGDGNINDNLKESLRTFFEQEQTEEYFNQEALLESKPLSVAIWRDDKVFYVFDSKPRDKNGLTIGMEDWSEPEPPPPEEEEEEEKEGDETPADEGLGEPTGEEEFMAEEFPDTEATNFNEPPTEEINYDEAFDMNEGMEQGEEEGVKEEEEIVIPIIHKSSSYWREQEKKGKACAMWFTKLDDLIDHIYGNIAPKLKVDEPFALKSVKIVNTAQITDKLKPEDERNDVYGGDWYYFEEIIHGKWILRGTMNLMDKLFPDDNRGKQLVPASIVALAIPYIFSMICYNQFSVDTILSYGDKLFTFMKRIRRKQLKSNQELKLKEDEIEWLLLHETFDINDVVRRICLSKFIVTLEIEPETIAGDINAQNFEDILDVRRGLEEFFVENQYGVLQCKDLTVAIWRGEKTYYMFDGMNRGPNGVVSPNGVACITRYLDISQMVEVFLANLPTFGKNTFQIHKVTMSKDICPREREPKELKEKITKKVELGGFHNVIPGKCIVRGTINQENPKFAKEPNVLSAPIAVIALTMSLIHKADTWSRPIVDDIIEWGAELYDESMHEVGLDFNPWDEKLDVYRVKNDYKVGVLKANCEMRHMDQRGIIDTKDEYILNLRQGIERFFEENTHGIVVTDPLTLAIWEEQVENSEPLIYMFDPNPRGPSGMPLNLGTACVMTFVNAKVASDHIIGCILDPVQKMGEFTIVPVEIVVGNARTIRKLKRTQTRSEFVLSRCSKLVANEEKRALRKIAENERKRKEAKRLALIGRNCYYVMKGGEAIVRGYRSQNSDHYSPESRNNQDIANSIVSVVMHSLFSIDNWTSKHVDLILDTGDQLYIDSYIAYGPKDKKLGLENILRKFYLKKLEIHVTVYKQIISEVFNVSSLNRILDVYFQQEAYCMLSYYDQWVTVFFKGGYFYVFDPHERDIEGNVVRNDEKGTAIVSRFDDLGVLSLKLVQNLYVNEDVNEEDNETMREFTLWLLSVENK